MAEVTPEQIVSATTKVRERVLAMVSMKIAELENIVNNELFEKECRALKDILGRWYDGLPDSDKLTALPFIEKWDAEIVQIKRTRNQS